MLNEKGRFSRIPITLDRLLLNSDVDWMRGCWNWRGSLTNGGYGKICGEVCGIERTSHSVHRVAWMLKNGSIPQGMLVLHTCDNRRCCNPDHLELGSYTKNNRDAVLRGAQKKGEEHRFAKLTEAQARKILTTEGSSYKLASKYGVTSACIRLIRQRKNWKHLCLD